MVYRFDEDGHGEVFAESASRSSSLISAIAIPPPTSRRSPAASTSATASGSWPTSSMRRCRYGPDCLPITGRDLDMSLCFLRSMSPIHIQYLKNMGVGATLVASLMVGGRLWGLISCHHYAPRFLHYEMRAVSELLAETVATRIAALESFAQAQAELSVRRLEQRHDPGDLARWRLAHAPCSTARSPCCMPLGASGAALLFEGQVLTAGEVPSTPQLREIGEWLDSRERDPVIATSALATRGPGLRPAHRTGQRAPRDSDLQLAWRVSGLVSPGAGAHRDLGRQSVQARRLRQRPRRSCRRAARSRSGTSWSRAPPIHGRPPIIAAARLIGETVTDVVLQFRAVRMLITQNQLEQVSRQVRRAEQPVIVADPEGRILLANQAFERLVRAAKPRLRWIEDLPDLFADPPGVRQMLTELFSHRRTWRGEQTLVAGGEAQPMMLRADPVYSSPDHVLGFVLLFNDLTERRAADQARRRFQEDIVDRHRIANVPLGTNDDLVFRNLMASVVGNAQLAALEITDGVDLAHVPAMLESVQSSVERAAELLERLVWHAAGTRPDN